MKRYFAFFLLIFSQTSFAQDFPGYRTGNYTGVNGVFFNPANIADNHYKWDVNLFSLNTYVGNDQASFNLKNIGNTFNGDSLINQFIGDQAGLSSGMVSATINGPSVLFTTGQKSAFAFTTRARVMTNAIDIDGKFADKLINDAGSDPKLPYSINANANMRVNMNSWTEIGGSYGREILNIGPHFLKGGISLKYLAGVANAYVNIANLKGTIDRDLFGLGNVYLKNSTGHLEMALGGADLTDFDAGKLTSFQSSGFGGDIGFVYEFRPDDEIATGEGNNWDDVLNQYKFKIGVSLLDVGSIKYEKDMQRSGGYDIAITGNERLYLEELSNVALDDLKNYFDSRPQFFTPGTNNNNKTYRVNLPATLNIDADYHIHKGFYTSFSGRFNLANTSSKPFNNRNYSSFMLTPRYESREFGAYLPISYNSLTNLNAGVSFRVGPLFIGSGSVITALIGDSKQADVYVGVRFGGLIKNKVTTRNIGKHNDPNG